MAIVEVIHDVNTYNVDSIGWPNIQLIDGLGIIQLRIYYANAGDASPVWIELTKNSWKNTYNTNTQTISLTDASYDSNGSETPAYITPSIHKIKVKRSTSFLPYIKFSDGAKLSGRDLNIINKQTIHLLEEEAARLDASDTTIYSYIATSLSNYYTKTQIDGFFNAQTLIPAWASGVNYSQGDVVLHDDPYTQANTILIWYCLQDHLGSNGLQPSESGPGSAFWSVSQNDTVLDNLNYIRKLPGKGGEGLDWNSIVVSDADAYGLSIYAHLNQKYDLFRLVDNTRTTALQFNGLNQLILNSGAALWTKGNAYLAGSSWLNFTPSSTKSGTPVVSIKGRSGSNALEIVKSTATTNATSALFKVDDTTITNNTPRVFMDGGSTQFIGKFIWFANTETEDCYGSVILDQDGNPPFTEVRFERDVKFGTIAGCSDPFVTTLTIDASAGDIESSGDISASTFTTSIISADYLKTDGTGQIIAGSGTPTTSRVALEVTGSNTTLANRDVVYLSNSTGLWTKARANDPTTLAVGVVDNVSGSAGNQTFSVVFAGSVSGWTGLDIGNWYWLDKNTAGGVVGTLPTGSGELVDPVGIAVSATELFVVPARPHKEPVT